MSKEPFHVLLIAKQIAWIEFNISSDDIRKRRTRVDIVLAKQGRLGNKAHNLEDSRTICVRYSFQYRVDFVLNWFIPLLVWLN